MGQKCCPTCGQITPEPCGIWCNNENGEVRFTNGVTMFLPIHEYRIFRELLTRVGHNVTRGRLHDALYWDRQDSDDYPGEKIVDVYLTKLRKKLAPMGITVRNHWGRGFELLVPGTKPEKPAPTVGAADVSDLTYGAM